MASEDRKDRDARSFKERFPRLVWLLSLLANYWVRVILITLLGIWIGAKLDDKDAWIGIRYQIFRVMLYLSPREEDVQRTALVFIGDDEYYKPDGELQNRRPINRRYLAKLVNAASQANAAVIALDFSFNSPNPQGNPPENPQYQPETAELVNAIWNASNSGKKIVLTRTITEISNEEGDKTYEFESDIYGPNVLHWNNVWAGYHVLPDDVRNLPLVVRTPGGNLIESFCLAIARADNAPRLRTLSNLRATYYAGFLRREKFDDILSANELLNGDPRQTAKLANRVVILSGEWHEFSNGRGPVVAAWETPVGSLPGALIHANYFEALYDKRFYRVWEGWPIKIAEGLLALLVAVPFGIRFESGTKKALAIAALYVLILVVAYVSLINLGWFFDPFIPILMVTLHGAFEQIMHWREEAARKTP
jgi:CHASE2 domain-containing sensor protein